MFSHHEIPLEYRRWLEDYIEKRLNPIIERLKKMEELLKTLALGDAQAKDRNAELAAAQVQIKKLTDDLAAAQAQLAAIPPALATADQLAQANTLAAAIVTDTAPPAPVPAA